MKTLQLTILSISVCILVMVMIQSVSAQVAPVLGLPHAFFKSDHAVYPIQYNLTNATLLGTPLDLPAKALLFTFNATGDGQLTVELPRKIIDSTRNGVDKPYFVSLGDVNAPPNRIIVNEIQNNNESRILTIHFTKGEKQVEIVGTYFIENNSTSRIINLWTYLPPLAQFQRGIDSPDVTCKQGFQLILKAEDGSPACVTPDTAQKLIERGWTKEIITTNQTSLNKNSNSSRTLTNLIPDLGNDAGIVNWNDQTYYFETPNYTANAFVQGEQILLFHNVIFTLFPSDFAGLPLGGCEGMHYMAYAKFADSTSELLHIFVGSSSCGYDYTPIKLGTHTNPQAGLIFYDGKMKLLVSAEDRSQQNNLVLSLPSQTNETIYHDFPSTSGYSVFMKEFVKSFCETILHEPVKIQTTQRTITFSFSS